MSLILSGTDGLSDVDGSAATPAIRGTDANTGIFFPAADTIAFSESGTEAARFDSSGNFMQGTTSWGYSGNKGIQVRASGSDNSSLFLETASATIKGFMASDPTASRVGLGSLSNHPLVFIANDAERARIDSSGNVYIGTSAQAVNTYLLTLRYSGNAQKGGIMFDDTDSGHTYEACYFRKDGTQRGYIRVTSTGTTYATVSDYRLKENVQPMTGALAKIAALKPCTYTWKDSDVSGQGFIAHELQAVVPDCVTGEKDAVDENGNPKYQGIDTSFLVATLTAAIKEQQQMIETLQAKVAALEAK